ncbi:hypothetical protein [Pseudomonas soli]|uniref:Uncharacterized protein n=1 Tax=Pseudomonas soli TaxID=1306993 RepID=A0AAJ5SSD2_9PSED|nr:hypothetical protein [Pseudomonas soli]UXZ44647.1 hypothetical protein K7K07_21650 [Pseudomonas soli]
MDIESFQQCLTYIKSNNASKPIFETLLPYGSTLTGVIIGFLLNQAREWWKDRDSLKNKKKCIDEDVHRARHSMQLAVKECINILNILIIKKLPSGHNFPTGFKTPLLEEYFPAIAHTYSVQDRYILKELDTHTNHLEHLTKELSPDKGVFGFSLTTLEILNTCTTMIGMCDLLLGDQSRDNLPTLLTSLGHNNEDLLVIEIMSENAEQNNAKLKL